MFPYSRQYPPGWQDGVEDIQGYLNLLGFSVGTIDGWFGPRTENCVKQYQRIRGLPEDGVVTKDLFDLMVKDVEQKDPVLLMDAPATPPLPFMSRDESDRLFGTPKWQPYPATHSGGQEVVYLDDWEERNIVKLTVPVYKELFGTKFIRVHIRAADQILAFFERLKYEGLHKLILTRDGEYYPRYIRGSRYSLSNHAKGLAFDINAEFNGLGKTPAAVGAHGTVRPFVKFAYDYGIGWGGYFSRKDGMHFEVCKLMH